MFSRLKTVSRQWPGKCGFFFFFFLRVYLVFVCAVHLQFMGCSIVPDEEQMNRTQETKQKILFITALASTFSVAVTDMLWSGNVNPFLPPLPFQINGLKPIYKLCVRFFSPSSSTLLQPHKRVFLFFFFFKKFNRIKYYWCSNKTKNY